MIRIETETPTVQYNRLPDFKEKINTELLNQAIEKYGIDAIDMNSIRYETQFLNIDAHCGCTKRLKVTLTANLNDEYI